MFYPYISFKIFTLIVYKCALVPGNHLSFKYYYLYKLKAVLLYFIAWWLYNVGCYQLLSAYFSYFFILQKYLNTFFLVFKYWTSIWYLNSI